MDGKHVSSNDRAEILAEYYEKMQWRVRPEAHVQLRPKLFDNLPVELDGITVEEVRTAIKHLKLKKSSGPDGISPEM